MARLPGIQYGTQVQSLGRSDIRAPMRVANAEAAVWNQIGGIAQQVGKIIETNQVAEYSASMSNRMSELNAKLKHQKAYTPEELDEHGIQYNQNGRDMIPAHEVSVQLYKQESQKIYDESLEGMDLKGRQVLEKVYAQKYGSGIADVTANSINRAYEHVTAKTDAEFEDSIRSGSMEGAQIIGDTALLNGVWSIDYYNAKMTAAPSRVAESNYMIQMNAADDVATLERLQSEAVNDPILNIATANRVYGAFGKKVAAIESEMEAAAKELKTEDSSVALTELQVRIAEGEMLTGDQMLDETLNMKPADRNTAISAWRAQKGKVSISDEDSKIEAAQLIQSVMLPGSGGEDFFDRRANAQTRLNEMAFEEKSITTEDHAKFTTQLKAVAKMTVTTPDFDMVEDDIYRTITGAGKGRIEVLPGGEKAHGLGLALTELHSRALELGQAFNPVAWWDSKKLMTITKANEKSAQKWFGSTPASKHVTLTKDGGYDPDATARDLYGRVNNGTMTTSELDSILNAADQYFKEKNRLDELARGIRQ